tara:strand:- start:990 stop:1640 length:651 start_codon:yes stop_codon:yes gene_type:complete
MRYTLKSINELRTQVISQTQVDYIVPGNSLNDWDYKLLLSKETDYINDNYTRFNKKPDRRYLKNMMTWMFGFEVKEEDIFQNEGEGFYRGIEFEAIYFVPVTRTICDRCNGTGYVIKDGIDHTINNLYEYYGDDQEARQEFVDGYKNGAYDKPCPLNCCSGNALTIDWHAFIKAYHEFPAAEQNIVKNINWLNKDILDYHKQSADDYAEAKYFGLC